MEALHPIPFPGADGGKLTQVDHHIIQAPYDDIQGCNEGVKPGSVEGGEHVEYDRVPAEKQEGD